MTNPDQLSAPTGPWRLGRLAGVDLLIRPSLLLMAVVLVSLFSSRFGDGTGSNAYGLASLFVVALYISVLVHEIAHVVVARHYRMPVASVTLHLLGGETAVEGESRRPSQEFWTSIIGPAASLAIGGAAALIARDLDPGNAHSIVSSIATVNVLVAAFNMVPGLPLDGGRVFRALIWGATGREATGTKAAGWIGRAAAVVALILPIWWLIRDKDSASAADAVVGLLIAWFLWSGASHALRSADRNARLNTLYARTIGEPGVEAPTDAPPLSAELAGVALLRAMAATPSDVYRLTESDGTTYGRLRADAVDAAYRNGSAKAGSAEEDPADKGQNP